MHCFNGIGRVDDPANILGIFEILTEPLPIIPPGFDDYWIFFIPFIRKSIKLLFGQVFTRPAPGQATRTLYLRPKA